MGMSKRRKKEVYFAILDERAIQHKMVHAREDIIAACTVMGYKLIRMGYGRTDVARNKLAKKFMEVTRRPNDTLVMLDTDHAHPRDIVKRLEEHNLPVVGALCFRRSEPYDPQFYVRQEGGALLQPVDWDPRATDKGTIVGTGAIAIQRQVFEKLTAAGALYPWFRNIYQDNEDPNLGEDWYFGLSCERVGIPHYCDYSLISPHQTESLVDGRTWETYKQANPAIVGKQSSSSE